MKRRTVLAALGLAGVGALGWRHWPDEGLRNPCRNGPLPEALAHHDLVQAAWRDIDPGQFWDCHVHLVGETANGPSLARGPRLDPIGETANGPSLARGPRLDPIGETANGPTITTGRMSEGGKAAPAFSALPPSMAGASRASDSARGPRLDPIGDGEPGGDAWVNPRAHSLWSPIQYLQRQFYMNGACVADSETPSTTYVERLLALHRDFPAGARFMLLAFDHHHNERGERMLGLSPIYTSNEYTARVARAHPLAFEWIASVHPYREDCVSALEWAAANGARAVKWLPNAMGIDPASPLCDRFYQAMARLELPLLSHAGDEYAVPGGDADNLGNPLRLRRALDAGVRVIAAHCGSLGRGADLDRGTDAPSVPNLDLFTRLMDEPRYRGLLFGDISAMTQINYNDTGLVAILTRPDWHGRLVNGSDYPLPGVMPLISTRHFARSGLIDAADAPVLSAVRAYNPILFDYLLKRSLRWRGQRLSPAVFESRRVFMPAGTA